MLLTSMPAQKLCGGWSMKGNVVGTGLRKHAVQSKKKAHSQERTLIDRIAQVEQIAPSRRNTPTQGMQQWRAARAARVEALRAQVQAGTYQVDSRALAEVLLTKGNHTMLKNLQ